MSKEKYKMKKEITAVCLAASMLATVCACDGTQSTEHFAPEATVDSFLGDGEYIAFGDLAYDPTDASVLQTYLDCGFNVFVIHEDYTGEITDGVSNGGGLTDKYKARLQALTDKGVDTWIRNQYNDPDYVENDDAERDRFNYNKDYRLPERDLGPDDFDPYSVSGFFLCDEPSMYEYKSGKRWWHAMSEYEKLVDWYNKYYSDSGKFFHMNLFPSYAQNVYFTNASDPTEYCTYEEYVDYYVENFAKKINGPKSICVDNYPYKNTGEIRSGFYENLLLFANKTRDCNAQIENEAYKAKFGICIQAFTESGLCDIVCTQDISFQLCVGAAMGAELFHYYCYATLGIDRTKGIMTNANSKRIYDYVQQANKEYLPFAQITTQFNWKAMTAVAATNEADRENSSFSDLAGSVTMQEMADLKGATSTRDALIGYFEHKQSGQPGYMVVNCSLPSAQRSSGVVLDFGKHERVLVYTKSEDGVTPAAQEMSTIGGKLRLTVGAGEGVFVIPV